MTQEQIELINKIVWFIPIKNKRDALRKLLTIIVESINTINSSTQEILNQNHETRHLTNFAVQQNEDIKNLIQNIKKDNEIFCKFIEANKELDNFSFDKDIQSLDTNNYNKLVHNFIKIYSNDSKENLENREILKDILIDNNKDQSKYDLHNYFINNRKRALDKWLFYFDVYEKHFSRFRGQDTINLLEIGIQNGGGIQMWKSYFSDKYPNSKVNIYGIDIDDKTKSIEDIENNVKVFIGSQSDREFLKEIKQKIPKLDILIDDGGHTMEQQIITFEEMYEHVKDDGVYLCEDTHTSYISEFGGGYRDRNSFIALRGHQGVQKPKSD